MLQDIDGPEQSKELLLNCGYMGYYARGVAAPARDPAKLGVVCVSICNCSTVAMRRKLIIIGLDVT